jgi:cell division protein FtsB
MGQSSKIVDLGGVNPSLVLGSLRCRCRGITNFRDFARWLSATTSQPQQAYVSVVSLRGQGGLSIILKKSMDRKITRVKLIGIAIAAVAGVTLYGLSVHERFSELSRSWDQENALEEKIETLRRENTAIEGLIEDLGPDGREVERIAREELRWASGGQTVIDIPEKK